MADRACVMSGVFGGSAVSGWVRLCPEPCARGAATPSWTEVSRHDRQDRQYRRYAYAAAIVLVTPNRTISGRTRDVSRGGLCATLAASVVVGTDIELDIQLVFDDDRQSEPLRVPARIAWCTSIDDDYQVGVQFLPLTGEVAEYLTMFLRYLADGARARAQRPDPSSEALPEVTPRLSIDERFG